MYRLDSLSSMEFVNAYDQPSSTLVDLTCLDFKLCIRQTHAKRRKTTLGKKQAYVTY